jgi:hypothetical protein
MIRFVKGQMDLEEVQAVVEGLDQTDLSGQQVDGADAAVSDAVAAAANFIMDVAGGEHGLVTTPQLGFIQATLNTALAVSQLAGYSRVHSKSLRS